MRILQALPWYFPEALGGTEIYVAALSRWLKEHQQEVSVAAPLPGLVQPREYEFEGVPVFRYPIPEHPTRAETQEFSRVRGVEFLSAHLQRIRPEVVHFHTFGTGLGLPEAREAKSIGARIIYTTHASSLGYSCQRGSLMRWGASVCDGVVEVPKCTACVLQQRGVSKVVARVLSHVPSRLGAFALNREGKCWTALGMTGLIERNRAKQRELYELVDRFVVLTDWARNILVANGAPPGKIAVNRLGVSQKSERAVTRREGGQLKIGYLGRFEDIKGVLHLAQAFARLPQTATIQLEFRGPATRPDELRLLNEIKQLLSGDNRVRFEPPVKSSEVPAILRDWDLLCCPSICLEGGPTVALEAHAAGTPVIGSRIGGLAEIIQHDVNGWLFEPGNIGELRAILERVALEPTQFLPRWRENLKPPRTMDQIASDYLRMYQS